MSWNYFDRVYCVHLPDAERRQKIAAEFQRVGIGNVTYVHARPPAAGFHMTNMRRNPAAEFGCALSHIRAVLQSIVDGAQRPLFFEDDVEFIEPQRIDAVVRELPEWEVLYFGGHPREACRMATEHLASVGRFSFAEAYALSDPAGWLAFWLDRVGQPDAMYDLALGEYAAAHRAFCVYPLMTRQPIGYSKIGRKIDDKSRCLDKGWRTNLSTK